jgi:hypothetical protein
MQACRVDGLLLKPDRPAFLVDTVAYKTSFTELNLRFDHVHHTFSTHGDYSWHYLLCADNRREIVIIPSDLGIEDHDESQEIDESQVSEIIPHAVMFAFSYHQLYELFVHKNGDISKLHILPFSVHTPIEFLKKKSTDKSYSLEYDYSIVAPLLSNGWIFLGEIGKIVSASAQRFDQISETLSTNQSAQTGIVVSVVGVPNEELNVAFVSPDKTVFSVKCKINASGQALISCSHEDSVTKCNSPTSQSLFDDMSLTMKLVWFSAFILLVAVILVVIIVVKRFKFQKKEIQIPEN